MRSSPVSEDLAAHAHQPNRCAMSEVAGLGSLQSGECIAARCPCRASGRGSGTRAETRQHEARPRSWNGPGGTKRRAGFSRKPLDCLFCTFIHYCWRTGTELPIRPDDSPATSRRAASRGSLDREVRGQP
jgi:hypothetical protein